MKSKPKTTEEYLAALPCGDRQALEAVRAIVLTVVPGLEELMSGGVPFFLYGGRRVVGFAAAKTLLSFYIMYGDELRNNKNDLATHGLSRTDIRFTREDPLPAELIQNLLRARIAEIDGTRHAP